VMKNYLKYIIFISLSMINTSCAGDSKNNIHLAVGRIYRTPFTVHIDGINGEGGEYPVDRFETISKGYDLQYLIAVRACKNKGVYTELKKFDKETLFRVRFYSPNFGLVFDFENNGNKVVGVARRLVDCEKVE
jgi:hypothetical protein